MSRFKKILLIFLLTLPFLISTGLSAWIIVNVKEDENPPDYNYKDIVNNAFNNQDKDYNGEALGPDGIYNGSENNEIIDSDSFDFYYYDETSSEWIKGLPTNSGSWQIKVVNPNDPNPDAEGIFITFTINKAEQEITVSNLLFTYDGQEHTVDEEDITVVFGDGKLSISAHTPRVDAGETEVTITLSETSNFKEFETTVKIVVERKNIGAEDVSGVVSTKYTYDGTNKEPSHDDLTLTYNGMKLNSSDYRILSYANNLNATKETLATVTIEGIGNYNGTRTIEFEIAKANQTVNYNQFNIYNGSPAEVIVDTNDEVELTKIANVEFFDLDKNPINAPINVGTYYVKVTIDGTDNYNAYDSDYIEYRVTPLDIANVDISSIDDIKYTASSITLPTPTITYNGNSLVEGLDQDYTLTYQNAAGAEVTEIINAGTYRVIVTGHGNFTGTKEIEFNVVKNAISAGIVTIPNETYTGNTITPNVTIIYDDDKLTEGVDYELSYAQIKNVGTYQVTIKGIGLYEGTTSSTLTVVEASIKDAEITGLDSLVYTGSVIDINPVITFNGKTLTEGTDYSYEIYKSSIEVSVLEAGNYVLKVTGNGNFTDSAEVEFSVSLRSVSDVTFDVTSNTYNALDQKPIVTATFNSTVISQDNYTVSYEYTEFVDAGEYTLTITGKGNLTGTTTVKYIIEKLDISNALADYVNTHYYTAGQIKPAITLTYASNLLTSGTDYTVVYGDNKEVGENVGTITVTATESSNFTGSKIYYFSIVKESIENAEIEGYESTINYTGNQYTPDITVSLNGVTLTQNDDYTVEYGTNVNAGTTTFIKITGTGIFSGSKTIEIEIIKADITGITFNDKGIVYNGNNNTIEIVGTLPTDVTVQYYYNNAVFTGATTVGEYLVTAKFTVNNANYNSLSDMTATLNITKATYDMSKVVFEDQIFTYDGNHHMVEITSGVPQGVTFKYYYNNQEFAGAKDFGTYEVIVKFTGDSTNYNEISDMSATLTIIKVKPVISITNNIYNVDYNSALNLENNYSISNNPDGIIETVSILDDLGNDVTNNGVLSVGTYTVTVTITGNTNTETVTNSFTLEINKVNPEYTVPTELTGIYGNELSTVELPTGWSFDSPEIVMNVVGEFNATITFTPDDTQNYNTVTETITIDVKKATITGITFESDSFTYDGTAKNILINGTLPTGITVKYYVDDEEFSGAVKAGTYEITAKFTDTTGNYNDIADLTATLTINQATFDMTGISFDSVNVDYNGQAHNLELTGKLPTNLGVKYYIGTTEFTPQSNAGTYVVIARFEDLTDGGANYILPNDLTATLTINQIMDPNYQEQPDLTAEFGQTLDDIKSQLVDGWAFVNDLQTSVGNGGINEFEVKYTPSDETNYLTVTKMIKVTVNRINPTFKVTNNNYTYDGSSKVAIVTSNSNGTITVIYKLNGSIVDTPINAGNYDIYVTISETQNYNSVTELKLDTLVINKYKIDENNASIGTISDQEYTGSKIEPSVDVTLNDTSIPFDGSCYTVTYQNNIELGTAIVIVNATGNFEGTLETSFTITQGAITDQSITAIEAVEYTGKDAIYDLIVTVNGKVLTKDTDYIVTVSDDIVNVGTVTIKVEGTGNYSGTGTVSFDITPVDINTSEDITIAEQVFVEGGNTPLPIVTITNIGTLQNNKDYTLTYTNNLGVGIGTITIEGTGNFTGKFDVTFNITPKDIKDVNVKISENLVYTGNEIEPVTDVTLPNYSSLTYAISYNNNINAGTASYTITGTGNFTGSVTEEFTISKFNLSELEDTQITLSGSTTYTALQITPSITVTFNGKTLEDSNYTASYGTNINVVDGGTVIITAKDNTNFTGSRIVKFDITARSISDAAVTVSDQTYTGSPITPNPQVVIDGIGTLVNGTDYELTYSSNVNVSSSPVTITITAKGNFAGQLTTTFKILPIDITIATVGEIIDVNYTGSAIEPEPTVTLTGFGKLTKDTDYKVTYENNTLVGTAKVIITGIGNFAGTVSQEFNIIDSIASSDVYFGELLNNPGDFTYTINTSHRPEVTRVIINDVTLVEGTHYEVTYGENINAGTGYVYITAIAGSGYEGSKEIQFTINKAIQTINYENIHVTYDGNNHMITATSSVGLGITYFDENDVAFTGAENAGTYTVIIKAAGSENYEAAQVTATIQIDKFNIENFVVGTHINGFQNSFVYTSNPITQELTILFNNKAINNQLTITYENNTNPTTSAKVLISVNSTDSNFTGTQELTFTITKAEQVITAENIEVVYGTSYDVTYTCLGDGTVNIKYYLGEEEISKPTNVGTYKAVISVLEGTYHLAGSKEIIITITGINPTFEIKNNEFDYTGQPVTIEYTTNSNGQVTIVYKQNGVVVENPTNVGEYTVEITQAASGNYLAYEITSTLVIKKIKPEILVSDLTEDSKIYFDYLEEYDLTEYINVTNNPEDLDYTIYYNGITTKPTVPGSYEVTVTIPATDNSDGASIKFTLVINKINAEYSGNIVFTATYGDLLSTITLPDGLTWKEPTATVGNVNASPNKHTAIYNPDEDLYNPVEVELSVVVEKAMPTYTGTVNLTATYGQTLADITSQLPEYFMWKDSTQSVGNASTTAKQFTALYNPDSTNYNDLEVSVNVTVEKVTPTYTGTVNLTATYGQTLADITSQLPEYFIWKDSTQSVGNASTTAKQFTALYNPDSTNYNDLEVSVNVTVGKATPTYEGTTSLTYEYGTVLQDIVLEGITWNTPTTTVGNVNGSPNSHTAIYNPDSTNYNDTTVTFNITVTQKVITGITFSNGKFNYDGYVHSLEISGTLPEGVNVEYLNNDQTEVGLYTVTAQFTDTTGNYVVPEDMTATLEITDKESIEIEIVDTTVTYTGKEQDIIINLYDENGELITDQTKITEIMNLITVLYDSSSDKPIDVKYSGTTIDTYEASISYTDNDKYELTCSSTTTALLTINPQEITSDNISEITEIFTYNGSKHTPEVEVTVNDKVLTKDTDYTVYYGTNTNVGYGYVTIVGKTNYFGTVELTFNITQADLTIDDSEWPTINPFVEGITPTLSFTSATINSVNGTFKFVNDVSNVEYQGTESTYNGTLEVIFSPENSNYKDVTKEISYIMYAVAYVGSTYYGTIADAVSAANTGTTKTAYVVPGLYTTYQLYIPVKESITIPNGVKLYIPYSGTSVEVGENGISSLGTSYADSSADKVKTNRATLINLVNGADITIESGAYLYLGGQTRDIGVTGLYAEINLDTGSMIDCSGYLYCYGYIKENASTYKNGKQSAYSSYYNNEYDEGRQILIQSGGYIKTPIAMYGSKTASSLLGLNEVGVFPISQFDFPNLQTYIEIESGGKFVSQSYILATASSENIAGYKEVVVVDTSSGIFYLTEGSVSFEYCPTNINYTKSDGVTRVYVNGTVEQGEVSISISGQTIETADKFLPISYKFNIYINDGGQYTTSYKVKMLPGSLIKINSGGIMNIDSEMIFYEGSYYNKISGYSVKTDAVLINNGTINITANGKLAAYIQTEVTDDSASLNFSNVTSSEAFTVTSIEGSTAVEITRTSEGYFVDESESGKSLYQFVAGSIVSSDINGGQCWNGEKYALSNLTISVTDMGYTKNIFAYEIYIADDANGTNQTAITSGTQNVAAIYELIKGKYVMIVVTRHAGAVFSDGTSHSSSSWYYISDDVELIITPNEGILLTITTVGESGNGTTSFTVTECSTSDGTFYEIATFKSITKGTTYVVKGWYFKVTGQNGTGTTVLDTSNCTITPNYNSSSTFTPGNAYQANAEYTVHFPRRSVCVAAGTLVTMADGTQKKVEDVTIGDVVLVFNHETGQIEPMTIMYNAHDELEWRYYDIINLEFSDGTVLQVINEHAVFDTTLNRYVFINNDTMNDFIGHTFYKMSVVDGEYVRSDVTLVNTYVTTEYTGVYNPISYYHLNFFGNGLLTTAGSIEKLINNFEYDDDLSYNQESYEENIEKYGIYTYEELSEYYSEEVFNSIPIQYVKIAVGKGIITWEEAKAIIDEQVRPIEEYFESLQQKNEIG